MISPAEAADAYLFGGVIKRFPVSLDELSRASGISLAHERPDLLSGALCVLERGNSGPMLRISSDTSDTRRLFSLAHALGRSQMQTDRSIRIEVDHMSIKCLEFRWANEFALDLLAPMRLIDIAVKKTRKPTELAKSFGIAPVAMKYQLKRYLRRRVLHPLG